MGNGAVKNLSTAWLYFFSRNVCHNNPQLGIVPEAQSIEAEKKALILSGRLFFRHPTDLL